MGSIYTATSKEPGSGKKEYNITKEKSVYFFDNIFNLRSNLFIL